MNQEHFTAKYSPLGIELQALMYNASYHFSAKKSDECPTASSVPEELPPVIESILAEEDIVNNVQQLRMIDIHKNSRLRI